MSNSQKIAFQEACVDGNSIEELLEAFDRTEVDVVDCRTWNISESEWMDAIQAAAAEKIRIWVSENESPELLESIAEWDNVPLETVAINEEGDIYAGTRWLDEERLIDFMKWFLDVHEGQLFEG